MSASHATFTGSDDFTACMTGRQNCGTPARRIKNCCRVVRAIHVSEMLMVFA